MSDRFVETACFRPYALSLAPRTGKLGRAPLGANGAILKELWIVDVAIGRLEEVDGVPRSGQYYSRNEQHLMISSRLCVDLRRIFVKFPQLL